MIAKSGFTKKSVGTLTLGEKLKKLRSDKRMSLGEVSRATRIQVKYLEYLEGGNYESLPADVYVKGFLRNYGDFLGIDEEILVKLYDKEKGIRKNLEKNKHPEKFKETIKPVNISSFVFTPKKAAFILVAFIVVATLTYLYRELGTFADEPLLVVLNPQTDTEINGNAVFVEGKADRDSKIFINNQPVLINDEGIFREEVTLKEGLNVIRVRSVNKFNKEASETLTVQAVFEEEKKPEENKNENQEASENMKENEKINIEIWVNPGPVWLMVEADGEQVFSGNMLSGAVQSFKAEEEITVNSGRGNATFVKFNGQEIGALGDSSNPVKEKKFNKEAE